MEKLYSVEQRAKSSLDIFKNDSDDEEPCSHKEDQRSKTIYKKKINKKKKNLYSMEDSEDGEISENEENLFMETVPLEDDSNMEGGVNLREELISAFEKLRKSRMKNNYLEENLSKCQEEQKSKDKGSSQIIIDLKN